MSYIGNTPFTAAFLVDTFSGNGSTVAFTMSVAPANTSSIIVAITGVVQDPSTYSVSGTTLTFSAAPPSGTSNISVRYLGIPASGVTTTAYRTVTDTTATAGQTTFTIPSYTVGYVDVYRNGVRLAAADYTATTGTTVVLASAASAGDTITTESFYVSSVLNAIPQYNGTSVNQTLTTPTANTLTSGSGSSLQLQTNGGTTALTLDTSGNAGLGVTPSTWSLGKALQVGTSSAIWGLTRSVSITSNSYYDSGDKYLTTGAAGQYLITSAGGHNWYTAASGTAGNAISFTQAMTLDASGNLNIGGTGLSYRIGGFVSASASLQNAFTVTNNANSDFQIRIKNDETWAGTSAGSLIFQTGATERARIDSSGNFSITSGNLTVGGTSTQITSVGTYNATTATAANMVVASNGSFYRSTSALKYKQDVRDVEDFDISALRPVRYKSKCEGDDQTKDYLGLIADEAAEAGFEELVTRGSNGEVEGFQYERLTVVLLKKLQTQQAIITQLQADVAALKGQA